MALVIPTRVSDHQPHPAHTTGRVWQETNCYLDLWIEVLHALGTDPIATFGCALSADHDGGQWTFLKPSPDDLRRIYGLDVTEEALWRPVLDTVLSGPERGLLHTVEVDSWWLPDTAGTDYRTNHVKTTIVPIAVDLPTATMTYVHNAGIFELSGDDFTGVFTFGDLPPYVEQIRRVGTGSGITAKSLAAAVRAHLDRRPPGNPARRLANSIHAALTWLPDAGLDVFHLWSFATLRQFGATAEIAADLADRLAIDGSDTAEAAEAFRSAAQTAKSVQFKLARAANGRSVVVDDLLTTMADDWLRGVDAIDRALPPG